MLFIFLFAASFALISGLVEAILWSKKGADAFTWNEHIALLALRGLVFFGLFLGFWANADMNFWRLVLSAGIGYMGFVGLHPSFYYLFRNKIDRSYPMGFFSNPSRDSTADINLSVGLRMLLILGSIILLVVFL